MGKPALVAGKNKKSDDHSSFLGGRRCSHRRHGGGGGCARPGLLGGRGLAGWQAAIRGRGCQKLLPGQGGNTPGRRLPNRRAHAPTTEQEPSQARSHSQLRRGATQRYGQYQLGRCELLPSSSSLLRSACAHARECSSTFLTCCCLCSCVLVPDAAGGPHVAKRGVDEAVRVP